MTYDELRTRIERRIQSLESCTHQLCSLSDECAEESEAKSLRQLLCEHNQGWSVFGKDCNWHTIPERPAKQPPTGAYCAGCGISWFSHEHGL